MTSAGAKSSSGLPGVTKPKGAYHWLEDLELSFTSLKVLCSLNVFGGFNVLGGLNILLQGPRLKVLDVLVSVCLTVSRNVTSCFFSNGLAQNRKCGLW